MKLRGLSSISLLWKILLSTSIAITVLFVATGWIVQDHVVRIASQSLEQEVRGSFRAYDSLWRSRAEQLASVSLVLSRMPDVRAAFSTGDQATIRDTAGEVWDKISRAGAIFIVTDPRGVVIAPLGGAANAGIRDLPVVQVAAARFPQQAAGFLPQNGRLYQVVVTPVYVAAAHESALLNVLIAGYAVDEQLAGELKNSTGSDFVFVAEGKVIASTLATAAARQLPAVKLDRDRLEQVRLGDSEYSELASPLADLQGNAVGEIRILRSFDAARKSIVTLRTNIVLIWVAGILIGLALTYALARRILKPVQALDRAAGEIGKRNYNTYVPIQSKDELGRLAQTFNEMCASIRSAREELIRQERIGTIGRLSTSIVHDLRNPLAAIYGGAEMLVDDELSREQVRRLANNIYRSSRRVQQLLQELSDVTRGRRQSAEPCWLHEVIGAAYNSLASTAQSNNVSVRIDVAENISISLERSPMERVFENLIGNAIEAMPDGGSIQISAERDDSVVVVTVEDTGPGIPAVIAPQLFHPFVTAGKKAGLGLGLAFSRQTVVDHGGDLWVDSRQNQGARFVLRLPL
jgi:signal transduction histidine kinase